MFCLCCINVVMFSNSNSFKFTKQCSFNSFNVVINVIDCCFAPMQPFVKLYHDKNILIICLF